MANAQTLRDEMQEPRLPTGGIFEQSKGNTCDATPVASDGLVRGRGFVLQKWLGDEERRGRKITADVHGSVPRQLKVSDMKRSRAKRMCVE